MIVNSFLGFVNESRYDSLSESIANKIIGFVNRGADGTMISRFSAPVQFTVTVSVARTSTFSPDRSESFKRIPWESINFEKNGFAIDANSQVVDGSDIREVDIVLVIDPKREPENHESIYYKLLDLVRHEIEHLVNNNADHRREDDREESQDSYKYFLLPDEIPSMVSGMRLSASKKGIPIEKEFADYLMPILASGFITKDQYDEVMAAWLKFAFSHFPDTN